MEIKFENVYYMSLDRYLALGNHANNKQGMDTTKVSKYLKYLLLVILFIGIIISYLNDNMPVLIGLVLLFFSFLYLSLFSKKTFKKIRYNNMLEKQQISKMMIKTQFCDVVTITEGKTSTDYKYSDFKKITEDDTYFYLWLKNNKSLKMDKKSFTIGLSEQFMRFFETRMKYN